MHLTSCFKCKQNEINNFTSFSIPDGITNSKLIHRVWNKEILVDVVQM